jgi:hypothetical protein
VRLWRKTPVATVMQTLATSVGARRIATTIRRRRIRRRSNLQVSHKPQLIEAGRAVAVVAVAVAARTMTPMTTMMIRWACLRPSRSHRSPRTPLWRGCSATRGLPGSRAPLTAHATAARRSSARWQRTQILKKLSPRSWKPATGLQVPSDDDVDDNDEQNKTKEDVSIKERKNQNQNQNQKSFL